MTDTAEEILRAAFAQNFEHWKITLPPEPLREGLRGMIQSRGWTIRYRVALVDGALCLEYFASHRMTNDRLERIRADGQTELLGYFSQISRVGEPDSARKLFARNRAFYAMVREMRLTPEDF